LLRRLMAHHLRQFNERIGARTLIVALDPNETLEYIDYRLRSKGGTSAKVFKRSALKHLVAASAGIPRRVNVLCHNAMLLAYAAGAKQVTLKMAKEAVAEYRDLFAAAVKASSNESARPRDRSKLGWIPRLTAVAAAIAGLVIALMAVSSYISNWNHRDDANGSREQTMGWPLSATSHGAAAEDGAASSAPSALPEYRIYPDDAEPAAASSTSASVNKQVSRDAAIRLAKQRDSEEKDE
jgi:hypothetical protein